METKDYISYIRGMVGTSPIIMCCAGVCIVDDQGRVLLQQRDKDGKEWSFPGGFINFGETLRQAAVREVKEETGYEVAIDKTLGVYDREIHTYPNGDVSQVVLVLFRGHIISGQPKIDNTETFALEWFKPEEAPKLFLPEVQEMLDDYIRSGGNFTEHPES